MLNTFKVNRWLQFTLLSLFVIFLNSCSKKVTSYQYKGTFVTRVDFSGEIFFYFGDNIKKRDRLSYVKAKYSGFDGSVDAFLLFNTDGTVEVIRCGGGYFTQNKNAGRLIFFKDYENPVLSALIDSYDGNYRNLIRISDVIEYEKKINLENNSQVTAIYP